MSLVGRRDSTRIGTFMNANLMKRKSFVSREDFRMSSGSDILSESKFTLLRYSNRETLQLATQTSSKSKIIRQSEARLTTLFLQIKLDQAMIGRLVEISQLS